MAVLSGSTDEITKSAQEGIDRFAELVEEYKRMKGVHGDRLQAGSHDLYTGILADAMLWARLMGVDALLAIGEAYKIALRESAE